MKNIFFALAIILLPSFAGAVEITCPSELIFKDSYMSPVIPSAPEGTKVTVETTEKSGEKDSKTKDLPKVFVSSNLYADDWVKNYKLKPDHGDESGSVLFYTLTKNEEHSVLCNYSNTSFFINYSLTEGVEKCSLSSVEISKVKVDKYVCN